MTTPRRQEPTIDLLRRSEQGDETARRQLLQENLEPLRRWALMRVAARGLTPDAAEQLVRQSIDDALPDAIAGACQCEADVQANLRMDILQRLCDPKVQPEPSLCRLSAEVGADVVQDYELGLAQLADADRRLIILRLELASSYETIAEATELSSAAEARAATAEAIVRLAEAMRNLPKSHPSPSD